MKKVFSLSSIAVAIMFVFMFSCNKTDDLLPDVGGQDVSFEITNNTSSNTKKDSGEGERRQGDIVCTDYLASYVKMVINGQVQKVATFYVSGKLYTNTISLPASPEGVEYTVSDFQVFFDKGTPSNESDDILISATPHAGSTFGSYVHNPLNMQFVVKSDKKTAIAIEVLCYEPKDQASFGFGYFGAEEVIVRTINFFGDFCLSPKSEYLESEYAKQTEWANSIGEFIDVPAIAKIEVWRAQGTGASTLQNTFSNSVQGETIKVTYGDYKAKNDKYEFKLYIYQKMGTSFGYKYVKSFIFEDAQALASTSDAHGTTTYYVLGDCMPTANYVIPIIK